jgi:chorismate synthase
MQKYDFSDARPVLERASARETAARVALGAVARRFLRQVAGVEVLSHVVSIGKASIPEDYAIPAIDAQSAIDDDEVRCAFPDSSIAMIAEINDAHANGDTLGGVVEVLVYNLPPGLGSHVHWDRRIDSRLAGALMGIQAIKGVEIGDGFKTATRRGSQAHDEIEEVLRLRAAMKPISTVPKALDTIDTSNGEAAKAINQRSDVCAVPAAGIVAEAMVALVLADAITEKFGGDSLSETKRNLDSYLKNMSIK